MQPNHHQSLNSPTWKDFLSKVHSGGGLWITSGIFHYIGIAFAYLFYRLGIRPNWVTFISSLFTLFGLILILAKPQHTYFSAITVLIIWIIGYAMDCSDGQLARVAKQGSLTGAWLDHLADAFKLIAVNLGFGWFLVRHFIGDPQQIALSFLAFSVNLMGNAMFFFGWNLKVGLVGADLGEKQLQSKKADLLKLPFQLTDFGLFIFLVLLLPSPERFLLVYLGYGILMFCLFAGYLLFSGYSLAKEDKRRRDN